MTCRGSGEVPGIGMMPMICYKCNGEGTIVIEDIIDKEEYKSTKKQKKQA